MRSGSWDREAAERRRSSRLAERLGFVALVVRDAWRSPEVVAVLRDGREVVVRRSDHRSVDWRAVRRELRRVAPGR